MTSMPEILITGTSGFIGNNFSALSKYRQIKSVSLRNNSPRSIDFSRSDTVLHLAALVHSGKNKNTEEYFYINRDLTITVAEEAKKAGTKQFIFLSTSKVYGVFDEDSDPWTESSPCFPIDPYGRSKYEAELLLKKLEDENFTVSIIRTPLVYGNGVKANMLSLIRLVQNFYIIPFAGINNKRNFTSAENLVGFIDRIIEKRASGTFIAMDEKPVSTTDLIKLLADSINKKVKLVKIPEILVQAGKVLLPSLFEPLFGSIILNNEHTKKVLDFQPPLSAEEGIKKMISSYLINRKH
jgi:UDP-glucose 4-epimerase